MTGRSRGTVRPPPTTGAMQMLLPILFLSFSLRAATAANEDYAIYTDCPSDTNYTRGGAFQANLDALLSSLPAAVSTSSGFAKNATGAAPDQAFGLAQCRADVNASDCRACLDDAAREVTRWCPGQKSAMIIHEYCLLRHSNTSFFGAADASLAIYVCNAQNATQPDFMSRVGALISNLSEKAAYGTPRLFAAGATELTPFVKLYGMARCTLDLAASDCHLCLSSAVAYIPKLCDGKLGGRIIHRSCSVRFEVGPFYNAQAVEVAMSPAPAPAPVLGGGPGNRSDDIVGPQSTGRRNHTARTALLISIPAAVIVMLLVLLLVVAYCKRSRRKSHNHVPIARSKGGDEEEMRSSESLFYDFSTLRAATGNFSEENKLGEGGFGPVYKGTLPNGQEIAVKRLSRASQQGQEEMKNEVVLVAKLQHKNLARILGYCMEEQERLLVYEFLSNNSLDKILFDPVWQKELGWGQRYKIIEGISRGLLYLHEDSRLTVIHRDLKASNILLDAEMNPKISDFGLARLFNIDSSIANTSRIAGTHGYMAPEYAMHGLFSTKSDVFSYGVLVLEIITGRRNAYTQESGPLDDLLTFVWRSWSGGSVQQLLDGCPADERRPHDILRCVHVGLLCVQEEPHLRPNMASVVIMLKSRSMTLPAPTAPASVVTTPGERTDDRDHSGGVNQ